MSYPLDRYVEKDPRLSSRDTRLPEGAIVLIHQMSVRRPELNYKLLVYEDGRIFVARNSGKTPRVIVDTDFPQQPERKEGKSLAVSIKKALLDERFFDLIDIQSNDTEGGWVRTMLARVDGRTNEVMYANARSKVFELLGLK